MSKLYNKYILLKTNNSGKFYLFECGIFYIFIHEDAIFMSNLLNLKLSPLNSVVMKCGFSIKSANKYLKFLKNLNYDIEIVLADNHISPISWYDYDIMQNYEHIIYNFLSINIDELSISQAFDLLNNLQHDFKKVELGKKKYEEKK